MNTQYPLKTLTIIRDGRASKMLFRFVAVNSNNKTRKGVFAFSGKAAPGAAGVFQTISIAIDDCRTIHRGCTRLKRLAREMRRKVRESWKNEIHPADIGLGLALAWASLDLGLAGLDQPISSAFWSSSLGGVYF